MAFFCCLKFQAAGSTEMFVIICQITWYGSYRGQQLCYSTQEPYNVYTAI
jgi:hypothetical protein